MRGIRRGWESVADPDAHVVEPVGDCGSGITITGITSAQRGLGRLGSARNAAGRQSCTGERESISLWAATHSRSSPAG